jgi:hypothetical protein
LIDWPATALLVWQAPLPDNDLARVLDNFLASGRSIVFLPPTESNANSFAGWQWGPWSEINRQGQAVRYWNSDEDLLARTRNGQPLPVNELRFYQYSELQSINPDTTNSDTANSDTANSDTANSESANSAAKADDARRAVVWPATPLATLADDAPLLQRCKTSGGTIYFLSTWPVATHSSLEREGITLFIAVQRAIAAGSETIGNAKTLVAGTAPAQVVTRLPRVLGSTDDAWLEGRGQRAGVYGDPNQWVAVNRPPAEDRSEPLTRTEVDGLFAGLDVQIVDDQVGSGRSLASEIWRLFVIVMGLALVAEAVLCLPPKLAPAATTVLEPARAAA